MKSRTLLSRVRKAAITPTAAERIALEQGKAAELAQQAEDVVDGRFPDWRTNATAFHEAYDRAYARYMEKFPPGYDPFAQALKAFAAAAPQSSRPRVVREGATLEEALEAWRRRIHGQDDDLDVVDVAGRP